ncbi:hypothetical protein E2C01_034230 [Portunus trituberculatus]|uniref:Uncharacterized protein n=1 Tax=Portunus trituberculatus TaxID=210409 RepID=A0A5B7F512_PORTR|nr:hypothetical protein [Portunus trituberculatus]
MAMTTHEADTPHSSRFLLTLPAPTARKGTVEANEPVSRGTKRRAKHLIICENTNYPSSPSLSLSFPSHHSSLPPPPLPPPHLPYHQEHSVANQLVPATTYSTSIHHRHIPPRTPPFLALTPHLYTPPPATAALNQFPGASMNKPPFLPPYQTLPSLPLPSPPSPVVRHVSPPRLPLLADVILPHPMNPPPALVSSCSSYLSSFISSSSSSSSSSAAEF